ncbi:MAG: hypothetical protein H6627_11810 [Calditrichae bacterium]|nr:hypothetical protein [Calditrichota bacterium]MCB9059245.1 hypothetical protein [Calditrichia bacterium]
MFSSQIAGTANTISTSGSSSNVFSNDAMGKEEFLQLLVAQLQNQDPLSPMEGQEFASQLAQFSSVEQLTSIDNNIQESINTDLVLSQTINNTLATALIGKQVTAAGNELEIGAEGAAPIDVYFSLAGYSDKVTVSIMDEAGHVVRTLNAHGMSSGIRSLEWDGKDDDGDSLPEGTYSFTVDAIGKDGAGVKATELIRGLASALQFEGGGATIKVGQVRINFGDVLEISNGLGA